MKEELKKIKEIYEKRMKGETEEWSSYTECQECGDAWLVGFGDNLEFICPHCDKEPMNDRIREVGGEVKEEL